MAKHISILLLTLFIPALSFGSPIPAGLLCNTPPAGFTFSNYTIDSGMGGSNQDLCWHTRAGYPAASGSPHCTGGLSLVVRPGADGCAPYVQPHTKDVKALQVTTPS